MLYAPIFILISILAALDVGIWPIFLTLFITFIIEPFIVQNKSIA